MSYRLCKKTIVSTIYYGYLGPPLERFIDCGDLHKGFARIYCHGCGYGYILVFSCKIRYFCPSCHQERMLAYGDWVEDEVPDAVS
ncbi:MAG: transposase zinc-binding domain-containing protein [Candidatus Sedimenticola sp. (ex Thyasira tokunagai)]